jgi:VWFA-related protein
MPKRVILSVLLFLAGATAGGLFSQEPASPKPATDSSPSQPQKSEPEVKTEPKQEVSMQDTVSTFKLRVNLVQVHVIVRGDAGKPVGGLHQEDFQLYDNGKLQTITTFGVEDAQSRKERMEAAAKTQANEEESGALAASTLPERFVALTFDDIHLVTVDVAPMRVAAERFIDSIGPADRVGIFTTSGQLTQDFISDKDVLKQKLLALMSRGQQISSPGACPNVSYAMAVDVDREGGPPIPAGPGQPADDSASPAFNILVQETLRCSPGINAGMAAILVGAAVTRVLNVGETENRNTCRQLENVVRLLASKPGERVLLLASAGFPIAKLTTEASGIVDHANRANIVINAIDARGLYTANLLGDISEPSSDPPALVGQKANYRLGEQMEQQFVLMDFSYGTGGRFFHNSNDLEGGLKQLGMVPDVAYVLGFSPQNQKMDGHFHTIKVTLANKQKYSIQARRGYFAPKQADDPREAEKQEMQDAVFSRDEIYDLAFTLQTQYFKTGDTVARLSVVSHLDLKGMRFRAAEGKHSDDVTFATAIFDDNGNYVTDGGKVVKLRLEDDTFQRLSRTGLTVKSSFELKPGKYLVRQVVRDSEGAQMAARNGTVVIPD